MCIIYVRDVVLTFIDTDNRAQHTQKTTALGTSWHITL